MAKSHRANPAACLRIESVYGTAVLLSGLASLLLSSKEEATISRYYKVYIQRLLKLHQATPAPVVFLLAGCLPLPAQLHLRMFSLYGQLCRLKGGDNILTNQARNVYSSSSSPSSKSWFWRLRKLALQYDLPHPWLKSPPSKVKAKTLVKAAVLKFWLADLREKAGRLKSLKYLRSEFLGLTRCHPMFWSCGSSPWEAEKATTKARLLSGRYRVEPCLATGSPGTRMACAPYQGAGGPRLLIKELLSLAHPVQHQLPDS